MSSSADIPASEDGFSLTEVLVVGGLAITVCIVTYSALVSGAKEATVQADIRNAVTAAWAYAADNGGSFDGLDDNALIGAGHVSSPGVNVHVVKATELTFVLEGSRDGTIDTWTYDSSAGTMVRG